LRAFLIENRKLFLIFHIFVAGEDNKHAVKNGEIERACCLAQFRFVERPWMCISVDRCGRVANSYRSPQEHGLLSGPILFPKPCLPKPLPHDGSKVSCPWRWRRGRGMSRIGVEWGGCPS